MLETVLASGGFPEGTQIALLEAESLPHLRNRDFIEREFFSLLDSLFATGARVTSQHMVLLTIDEEGAVQRVSPGSGSELLDARIRSIWGGAEFEPMVVGDCRVTGWYHVPLRFVSDSTNLVLDVAYPRRTRIQRVSVDHLIDVDELLEYLRTSVEPTREPLVYRLDYASSGMPTSASWGFGCQDEPQADDVLASILRRSMKRISPEYAPLSETIAIQAGPRARVRMANIRSADLLHPDRLHRSITWFVRSMPAQIQPPEPVKVAVILKISGSGQVLEADVLRSSGVPVIDIEARRLARELRFRPARLEGKPVPQQLVMWLDF